MSEESLFSNLNTRFSELWKTLQKFTEELEEAQLDDDFFVAEDSAKLNVYINNYANNIITVGAHLARVKAVKQRIASKMDRLFGRLYVEITEKGPPNTVNVSKFDQDYRKGKVLQNEEYIKYTKFLADLTELEGILEAVKVSLNTKAMVLPTMFKLEKDKF